MAVLENQNKALIEELKSLKELYTGNPRKVNLTNSKVQHKPQKAYLWVQINVHFSGGKMMWTESTFGWNIFLQTMVKNWKNIDWTETGENINEKWQKRTSVPQELTSAKNAKWSIVRFVLRSYPWSYVLLPYIHVKLSE